MTRSLFLSALLCGWLGLGLFFVRNESMAQPGPGVKAEEDFSAEGFAVNATVDKSVLTIGDKIRFTIHVLYPEGTEPVLPEFARQLGGFAVLDFGKQAKKKLGKELFEEGVWYELDTYLTGSYVIPSFEIRLQREGRMSATLKTPEIFIEVKSVIAGDDALKDIRDLKAPGEIPFDRKRLLLLAVLVALGIAGLGGGVLVWFNRKKKKDEPLLLSPDQEALEELSRIRTAGLVEKGEIKEFYYCLTTCLRRYLERRFLLRALEQTTEEFIEALIQEGKFDDARRLLLERFLASSDFVKFAKYRPEKDETEKAFSIVEDFIKQTTEKEEQADVI